MDFPEDIHGEHPPLKPRDFALAARDHFHSAVDSVLELTPDNHELVTDIEDQTVVAEGLKFKLKRAGNFAVEHKTEIIVASAAVITVAGLLKARGRLRVRKK